MYHYAVFLWEGASESLETITSRKNPLIWHLRELSSDSEARRLSGEYLCDGLKMLDEALASGARILCVAWKERPGDRDVPGAEQFVLPAELFDYVSPMKNSPGPVFTVAIRGCTKPGKLKNALILEGVQDPGNVGTVIRTANAFGIGAVILLEDCADLYHPKTVRSTMGAIFRQTVLRLQREALPDFLRDQELPLYGAALHQNAADLRTLDLKHAAVAVGSEGQGLSPELLAVCAGKIIIPMRPESESLNAAVAASVLMWEMAR